MRLSEREVAAIADTAAAVFGPTGTVRLYGSRLDEALEGGDIDLYVEVDPGCAEWKAESAFRIRLGDTFGETPVDVVVHERGRPRRPIEKLAHATGAVLGADRDGTEATQDRKTAESIETIRRRLAKDLLAESIAMAEKNAHLLAWLTTRLADIVPFTKGNRNTAPEDAMAVQDSLLKRVENMQDILQRRVFRALLMAEGEPVRGTPAPDIAEKLQARGAISDAARWQDLAELRNKLAHDYPLDFDRQAERLNQAYAAIGPLIDTLDEVKDYVARRPDLRAGA